MSSSLDWELMSPPDELNPPLSSLNVIFSKPPRKARGQYKKRKHTKETKKNVPTIYKVAPRLTNLFISHDASFTPRHQFGYHFLVIKRKGTNNVEPKVIMIDESDKENKYNGDASEGDSHREGLLGLSNNQVIKTLKPLHWTFKAKEMKDDVFQKASPVFNHLLEIMDSVIEKEPEYLKMSEWQKLMNEVFVEEKAEASLENNNGDDKSFKRKHPHMFRSNLVRQLRMQLQREGIKQQNSFVLFTYAPAKEPLPGERVEVMKITMHCSDSLRNLSYPQDMEFAKATKVMAKWMFLPFGRNVNLKWGIVRKKKDNSSSSLTNISISSSEGEVEEENEGDNSSTISVNIN